MTQTRPATAPDDGPPVPCVMRARSGVRRLIIGLALGLLAGCDRASEAGGAATTRAVDDAPPMRIVTLAPNAAEMIAAIGLADRIVGVSDFCVYPEELTKRPRVGGIMNPDGEKILLLDPDLVVLRGRMPTVESLCAKRGIEMHYDKTDSLDDIFKTLTALGDRLDAAEAARAAATRLREQLDASAARVAGRDRPRVLMIVNRDVDGIRNVVTFGRGAFVNDVIAIAGGVNVFGHMGIPYPQVSTEEILAARPDVIIEAVESVTMTDARRATMLAQWAALPSIPAVKNHRIHILTEDFLLIPSPRVAESVRLLSGVFHPEVERE